MSKKIVAKKIIKKVKTSKFKLLTYTMKAIIPTGMYANLQPEITVQAETIEHAERAVMPYIEALFAKYREGGTPIATPQPAKPVTVQQAPRTETVKQPVSEKPPKIETKIEIGSNPPTIIFTVPYTRAKTAIDSCTSIEALKLVVDQVKKSVKITNPERLELVIMAEKKMANFPIKNA